MMNSKTKMINKSELRRKVNRKNELKRKMTNTKIEIDERGVMNSWLKVNELILIEKDRTTIRKEKKEGWKLEYENENIITIRTMKGKDNEWNISVVSERLPELNENILCEDERMEYSVREVLKDLQKNDENERSIHREEKQKDMIENVLTLDDIEDIEIEKLMSMSEEEMNDNEVVDLMKVFEEDENDETESMLLSMSTQISPIPEWTRYEVQEAEEFFRYN